MGESSWQDRVQGELDELDGRIDWLLEFIDSRDYAALSLAQQTVLLMQSHAMALYREALDLRLMVDEEERADAPASDPDRDSEAESSNTGGTGEEDTPPVQPTQSHHS